MDSYKDGKFHHNRDAWVAEAGRWCRQPQIDLSRFYARFESVNTPLADQDDWINTTLAIGDEWAQEDRRWCSKYEGPAHQPAGLARCPTGGFHELGNLGEYALLSSFPGQLGCEWGIKCESLISPSITPCVGGCTHDHRPVGVYHAGSGSVGYPGQDQRKMCKCFVLGYSNTPGNLEACPAGGTHDHSSNANCTLALPFSNINQSFPEYETDHTFGLMDSLSANRDTMYGDQWEIMSARNVKTLDYQIGWAPAGPGLNAPSLYKLGWITDDRVVVYNTSKDTCLSVNLVTLNQPDKQGPLMALIQSPNHLYSVEFRRRTGWDAGNGQDAILMHELRSTYLVGQREWRCCNKCQGLMWTGCARCPAGTVHDHSTSATYNLVLEESHDQGQKGWKRCTKCQGLVYADFSVGLCPAGNTHVYASSGHYGISMSSSGISGQGNWKWCSKCQGLSFAGNPLLGICSAGGSHDHSSSAAYTLSINNSTPGGQYGWRWCRKCQGLAFDGYNACAAGGNHNQAGSDIYSLSANDPHFPGQPGWKFCTKCFGLTFSSASPGSCPAGGVHNTTSSANFSLLANAGAAHGQNNWFHCFKCHLLVYSGQGPCPAGAAHDISQSANYTLATFAKATAHLIGADWQAGQVYLDVGRNVSITFGAIDAVADSVNIAICRARKAQRESVDLSVGSGSDALVPGPVLYEPRTTHRQDCRGGG
jgi:hypothetical protein